MAETQQEYWNSVCIPLTKGQHTVIDVDDFELVKPYSLHASKSRTTYYVAASCGKHNRLQLHRLILSAPKGIQVDHRNGDALDNRRANLRLCTGSQNAKNLRKRPNCIVSRYKGVWRCRSSWQAMINVDHERVFLGTFPTEEMAALAYNHAALELHGEFACLNELPPGTELIPIRQKQRPRISKFKGVSQQRTGKPWRARYKKFHLGSFDTEEEASRAYEMAEAADRGNNLDWRKKWETV